MHRQGEGICQACIFIFWVDLFFGTAEPNSFLTLMDALGETDLRPLEASTQCRAGVFCSLCCRAILNIPCVQHDHSAPSHSRGGESDTCAVACSGSIQTKPSLLDAQTSNSQKVFKVGQERWWMSQINHRILLQWFVNKKKIHYLFMLFPSPVTRVTCYMHIL